MSTLREAAQQALEALEFMADEWGFTQKAHRPERWQAIDALRDALAQQDEPKGGGNLPPPLQAEPVQEPVAYSVQSPDDAKRNRITPSLVTDTRLELEEYLGNSETAKHIVPLYTAPLRREWQGLRNKEIVQIVTDNLTGGDWVDVARAIEAALKEKNA